MGKFCDVYVPYPFFESSLNDFGALFSYSLRAKQLEHVTLRASRARPRKEFTHGSTSLIINDVRAVKATSEYSAPS